MDVSQSSRDESSDEFVKKLANKLVERALEASSFHDADMDTTVLGKPGNLAIPRQAPVDTSNLSPSVPSQGELEVELIPIDDNALLEVLNLRGGAKAMKAMKAPMKAAMKAPMKA